MFSCETIVLILLTYYYPIFDVYGAHFMDLAWFVDSLQLCKHCVYVPYT